MTGSYSNACEGSLCEGSSAGLVGSQHDYEDYGLQRKVESQQMIYHLLWDLGNRKYPASHRMRVSVAVQLLLHVIWSLVQVLPLGSKGL